MSKCGNCGGDNEPAAVRCAYCDGALEATSSLQVAWLARADGVQGEGRIDLVAGGGVTTAQVRSAAESAFLSAVGALGPQAKGADVQARMTTELPGLLPAGVEIRELSMTAYRRGGAPGAPGRPAARPARRAVFIPLAGLLMGACCLGSGLLMVVVGESTARRIHRVEAAPIVANLAETKDGPVCLEGVAAQSADSPIEITLDSGVTERCIYVHGTSASHVSSRTGSSSSTKRSTTSKSGTPGYTKQVDFFTLVDGTRVRVSTSTNWSGLESLGTAEVEGRRLKLTGIRATAPVLTLVGTTQGQELTAEEVTTAPTRDALIGDLTETRYIGDAMGLVCLGTGVLLVLACLGVLFRKRR